MNLSLKKTALINLSLDSQVLPDALTPQIGGAEQAEVQSSYLTYNCPPEPPTLPHRLCSGAIACY